MSDQPARVARRRANGDGSITRRADGRWMGRYYAWTTAGASKRITVYGKTRQQVADKLRQAQEQTVAAYRYPRWHGSLETGSSRDDIDDYKVGLAGKHRSAGQVISRETHRQRMRTIRQFFERIIEWDWPDAPPRNPVIAGDIPKKPEPLPKFLDDRDAAKVMAAARASTNPRDRLVVELLARTGMRAGELADLEAEAVVQIGAGHCLRIPLGKLRNDRYVPRVRLPGL